MKLLLSKWISTLLLLACSLHFSISSDTASILDSGEKKTHLELANAQVDWLLSSGGSFDNDKVAIQPIYENDETSLGLFANGDITRGDILIKIPTSTILASRKSSGVCDAAMTLFYQVTVRGNSSKFLPYLEYAYSSKEVERNPSAWSVGAKDLLESIQGSLQPENMVELSFLEECVEPEDQESFRQEYSEDDGVAKIESAYKIALARSWEGKFFPILDMFNHHPRPNVDFDFHGPSRMMFVVAEHNIPKGSELFLNYRTRETESLFSYEINVATMLRDYGIVEDYPQQWVLTTPKRRSNYEENEIPPFVQITVHKTGNPVGDGYDKNAIQQNYKIEWEMPGQPVAHPIAALYLKKELARLEELRPVVMEQSSMLGSESEKATVLDYYECLCIAYIVTIASIEEAIELSPTLIEEEGDNFMACSDWDMLHEETYGWEYFDRTKSSHQEIEFYYNSQTRDACLFLEEYLHACVSNRPHYHEVFVHYPAYFLEKVERVLFIGGGDSMVLHEVLKYDDQLELVVGLELDQHVVRSTYSRLGTQPQFHNEKVEWWFGDAAEALNVLPTEYYGSFDLVVVDVLTEVAEALKVTKDVTIMEAAMMLMKPNGIIVKNEDEGYVPGSTDSSEFTKYTADVMYYDVPVYCLQTFVIGSNSIDFSTMKPYDHNISNFYIQGVDAFRSQFDTWYTTGSAKVAEATTKSDDTQSKEETNTSAMTMILEVEEISVPISTDSITQIVRKSGEKTGFSFKEVFLRTTSDGFNTFIIFEEAAVVTRCFSEKQYCAIDVQFWKSVDKAEVLKRELVLGLKSGENSIYRVVTTGVYGVEENDKNSKIGPPSKESLADEDTTESESNSSSSPTTFVERKNKEINFKNATFEDYDSSSALAQWHSQQVLGFQNIIRYELPFEYKLENLKQMVEEVVHAAIDNALPEKITGTISVETMEIGRGILVLMAWSEGDVVILWDGEKKLNLNMFALDRYARAYAASIAESLNKFVKRNSVDFFPRGTGRTISFPRDLSEQSAERDHPFWARPKEATSKHDEL